VIIFYSLVKFLSTLDVGSGRRPARARAPGSPEGLRYIG
jgi:hypothetical protein